jgi:hypothetical protein
VTGPFATLAELVRQKREAGTAEERRLQHKASRQTEQPSTIEPSTLCPYCSSPVDPVSSCWVGRGYMAHGSCAWAANDEFFLFLDEPC